MTSYGDSWWVTDIQWRLTRESYTVYCQAVLMTMFDKWQSWHYNGLRMFHTRMVLSVTGLTLQDTVEIAQVWQLTNDNDCHDICVMQHQTFSQNRQLMSDNYGHRVRYQHTWETVKEWNVCRMTNVTLSSRLHKNDVTWTTQMPRLSS